MAAPALDIRSGAVTGEIHRRHRSIDFRHLRTTVEQAAHREFEPRLVLDNASAHKMPLIHRRLLRHPRVHLHLTPISASRLNPVECRFSPLTARQLRRGRFRSTRAPEAAIRAYVAENNEHPKPFVRTQTADEVLASVAAFSQRIYNSHH